MDSDTLSSAASGPYRISARKERFPTPTANEKNPSAPGKRAGRDGASSGREKKRSKVAQYSNRASRSRVSLGLGPGVLGWRSLWTCKITYCCGASAVQERGTAG